MEGDVDGAVEPRDGISFNPDGHPRPRRRVLLGIRDLAFHQEVLDHLERDARLEVVAAVTWPGALVQGIRDLRPDVTVACPAMVREVRHPSVGATPNLMVVAEEMTVPVLREAVEAGARGVFAWPEERAELVEDVLHVPAESSEAASSSGRVIAVYGARGGSGATFVATQLAASFADRGQQCVLVDLDSSFADVTIALGVDQEARTIDALVPVLGELAPDHLEDVLFRHPRGFSVLLASAEPDLVAPPPSGLYPAAIALLAGAFDIVVLHVPRSTDRAIRAIVGMADNVVLVVAPDLFSLHAARRAARTLQLESHPDRCRIVLNPAIRGRIGRREIERVLGWAPFGAVRFDASVARAQSRSRLLPPRARGAAKDLRILADRLGPRPHLSLRETSAPGEEVS